MNLKNLKHFKKGITSLTPIQLSQGRLAGYYGMVAGLVLATSTVFMSKSWGMGIFLLFLTWFQGMGLLTEIKTLDSLKDMQESLSNQPSIEEFNNLLDESEKQMEGK